MHKIFAGSILAVTALVIVTLVTAWSTAHAQTIFNFGLCYETPAKYEQVYVQVHGDLYKQPLLVCYWTAAQTNALRAQLKAKYGY